MDVELLTPQQAGDILGMSRGSLAQMRYLGTGPVYVKLSAKAVRYRAADLEAWITGHLRTGTRSLPT